MGAGSSAGVKLEPESDGTVKACIQEVADPLAPYVGWYSDPGHPEGWRCLKTKGSSIQATGVDSKDAEMWTTTGTVSDKGMAVDFSFKGGPKDAVGVLVDGGLKFGENTWKKLGGPPEGLDPKFL